MGAGYYYDADTAEYFIYKISVEKVGTIKPGFRGVERRVIRNIEKVNTYKNKRPFLYDMSSVYIVDEENNILYNKFKLGTIYISKNYRAKKQYIYVIAHKILFSMRENFLGYEIK